MPAAHLRHGRPGQQFSMIEAALALFDRMHRHRDNQHLPGRVCGRCKSFEAGRQELTQSPGDRLHTLVLKQVNQRAKLAMVAAISHRFHKSGSG